MRRQALARSFSLSDPWRATSLRKTLRVLRSTSGAYTLTKPSKARSACAKLRAVVALRGEQVPVSIGDHLNRGGARVALVPRRLQGQL